MSEFRSSNTLATCSPEESRGRNISEHRHLTQITVSSRSHFAIDFADKSDGLSNISLYSTMSALSLDITYCIQILKKGIIPVTDSYLNKQKYFKKTLNNKMLISSLHQFDYQYCGKYVHCNNQQIKSFL